MQAIILSAGRGSRLLPLTTDLPKCLLPVGLSSVLTLQIDTLLKRGIEQITIVTGFNAHLVEEEVSSLGYGEKVSTLYNPFYQVADNLASCWMARQEMNNDFLLINGDTLFSPELLTRVLAAPAKDISVTIDQKEHYDGDDMKVSLSVHQLTAIGKTLLPQQTQGESIGMLRFMKNGPSIFKNELERLMRMEEGTKSWFLSAINGLALSGKVIDTTNIKGETWAELDTPEDYEICLDLFGGSQMQRQRLAAIK
ncbi:phosphocholine cytidylyltransferase family protein [Hellea sp.]|nr:phosphocholine cytidylyltransferase family protein [Hellea sp.]MDC1089631.1 phosphocholine cytidylyltransferase family protein [Hellea sp.]